MQRSILSFIVNRSRRKTTCQQSWRPTKFQHRLQTRWFCLVTSSHFLTVFLSLHLFSHCRFSSFIFRLREGPKESFLFELVTIRFQGRHSFSSVGSFYASLPRCYLYVAFGSTRPNHFAKSKMRDTPRTTFDMLSEGFVQTHDRVCNLNYIIAILLMMIGFIR